MVNLEWGDKEMQLLTGLKIAVIGGDLREKVYIPKLCQLGAEIFVYGNEKLRDFAEITYCETLEEINMVDAVVLPLTGISLKGEIHAPCFPYKIFFSTIANNLKFLTPIFLGKATPLVKELAQKLNLPIIEIADDDELAILNAVPTAEGALRLAIELTPYTIHGSRIVILGYGRVGKVAARLFKSVNAKVTIVARNIKQLALAEAFGFETVNFDNKNNAIKYADIIINTIPSKVIDKNDLTNLSTSCVIIDLASQPGGIDYETARQYDVIAVLASGLPGKVAPLTAGEIISRVLPKLIVQYFETLSGGQEG